MAEPVPVKGQIKETLISITIAFALAFVFRAFVIEAFVIPTGSMAPTLLGAHMRFTGPDTGANWPMNLPDGSPAPSFQNATDPMSRQPLSISGPTRQSGDRILVFKYLYSVYDPKRWDVVVFKAPTQPQTNYIKRLIGLPGEQLALVDGDVFTRTPPRGEPPADNPWALEGWTIARKPERVQRAVWQAIFDTRYAPLPRSDSRPFDPPWVPSGTGWDLDRSRGPTFECATGLDGSPAILYWDSKRWPIDDRYAYNGPTDRVFPVSDVRMRCGVEPAGAGLAVTAVLRARGHEFRARVEGTEASLALRPFGENRGAEEGWTELARGTLAGPLPLGQVTPIEFWHADQALELRVGGRLVAHAAYDWTLARRLALSTGMTPEEVLRDYQPDDAHILMDPGRYRRPEVRWAFSGGGGSGRPAFRLHAVGLDRDLFYQPAAYGRMIAPGALRYSGAAKATHPANTPQLGPDHFFVCGDNSPQSEDARLWAEPDEWVKHSIDPAQGVVPRDLLIGKAFFVYFPSLIRKTTSGLPMPDFGRMRFIW